MSKLGMFVSCAVAALALGGCQTGTPIVAGAVDQVGIAVSGGVQDQGGNLTVGYRGAKFAVVPVQNQNGELLALENGANRERGFSVFAMLGIDAKAVTPNVAVEQVVAVGPAAEIWAAGRSRLTAEQVQLLNSTR